jgi:hypothetical protein
VQRIERFPAINWRNWTGSTPAWSAVPAAPIPPDRFVSRQHLSWATRAVEATFVRRNVGWQHGNLGNVARAKIFPPKSGQGLQTRGDNAGNLIHSPWPLTYLDLVLPGLAHIRQMHFLSFAMSDRCSPWPIQYQTNVFHLSYVGHLLSIVLLDLCYNWPIPFLTFAKIVDVLSNLSFTCQVSVTTFAISSRSPPWLLLRITDRRPVWSLLHLTGVLPDLCYFWKVSCLTSDVSNKCAAVPLLHISDRCPPRPLLCLTGIPPDLCYIWQVFFLTSAISDRCSTWPLLCLTGLLPDLCYIW